MEGERNFETVSLGWYFESRAEKESFVYKFVSRLPIIVYAYGSQGGIAKGHPFAGISSNRGFAVKGDRRERFAKLTRSSKGDGGGGGDGVRLGTG